MKVIHASHLGGIKSAPDVLYMPECPEGPIVSYWRYKALRGEKGNLKDMIENRKGRVVFFTLPGWVPWPYGDIYTLDLPDEQECFAGIACLKHVRTTLKRAEEAIFTANHLHPLLWDNLHHLEIVIPCEWFDSKGIIFPKE
jgi:hypothetical protein